MSELHIRVPSIDDLLDPWSYAPMAQRPLQDEARDRIVEEWVEHRREGGVNALVVLLPAREREEGVGDDVRAAIHNDMERMAVDCKRHWFRRSLRGRKSRIGIVLFIACLLIAAGINYDATDAWSDTLAQTFVVIAWVALWDPGQSVVDAASNRLARKHYQALAGIELEIRWEERGSVPGGVAG